MSEAVLIDLESETRLAKLREEERIRKQVIPNVKSILIILSGRGMLFDRDALAQKVKLSYPQAKLYFMTPLGDSLGEAVPEKFDLLIDFTGPRQRHRWFLARHLRGGARFCLGRTAGFFREYIYDVVFDEKKEANLPTDRLHRERAIQRKMLERVGIPVTHQGTALTDLSKNLEMTSIFLRKEG